TAIVLRTALAQGRARAFATGAGIGTGGLIWGIAAATGVSVLLTASHTAYLALRVVGAAYLIWMGGRMLLDALRRKDTAAPATAAAASPAPGPAASPRICSTRRSACSTSPCSPSSSPPAPRTC